MSKPARFLVIIALTLAVVAAFAYVGGWLTPNRLGPTQMIAALEKNGGTHPGFRRNHSKGLCVTGFFDSSGAGARLSKASVFAPGRVPVVGRFALAGGQPFQADAGHTVRSFALRFALASGEEWRTGMNGIPVFPFKTPQVFQEQQLSAVADPATGKPDPGRIGQFFSAHPEAAQAVKIIGAQPVSSGFANTTFNSLNAFRFIATDGTSTAVRWSVVPSQAFEPDSAAGDAQRPNNYLFDALIAAIQQQPLLWHLVATIAGPADSTSDSTVAWPDDRQRVDLGTLTIDHAQSEDTGSCGDINYDPLILPSGIEASDDPLLSARSAAYSRSFTLRSGETKPPSAVQTPDGPSRSTTIATPTQFTGLTRLLHWLMAAMVLTMLFVGLGMVSTVSGRYHALLSFHRPLGIAILVLVLIRLVNRWLNPGPPLPAHLTGVERFAAKASQVVLYGLMILMPLIGWGMLSAARYPIVLAGRLHLPPILPHDAALYATLRELHTVLAYVFIATFIAHFAAALVHGLIYRDGVLQSMAPWRIRRRP